MASAEEDSEFTPDDATKDISGFNYRAFEHGRRRNMVHKTVVRSLTGLFDKMSIHSGGNILGQKRKTIPATSFPRFPELPDELQLKIIRFANMVPRLVEVRLPSRRRLLEIGSETRLLVYRIPWNSGILADSPWARPPALLQVSKKFRDEGVKIRPLALRMTQVGPDFEKPRVRLQSLPRVRINFDIDTLIFPTRYLESRRYVYEDIEKVRHLMLSYISGQIVLDHIFVQHIEQRMPNITGSIKVINRESLNVCRWIRGCDLSDTHFEDHLCRGVSYDGRENAAVREVKSLLSHDVVPVRPVKKYYRLRDFPRLVYVEYKEAQREAKKAREMILNSEPNVTWQVLEEPRCRCCSS